MLKMLQTSVNFTRHYCSDVLLALRDILCHGYQLFTRYSWVTSSVEQFIPLSSSGIFRQVTDPGSDLPVIHTSCLSRWPQMPSCRQSASYFTSKENKL